MHELGHGTVFKTKFLNEFFTRVTGFLNWNNYAYFAESHSRHHRYTLHPPDDLEVVLPTKVAIRQALTQGIVKWPRFKWTILFTIRIARGKFEGEWENTMFPASDPEKRRRPMRAARGFLAGHALIIAASIYFKLWLLPVVVTFAAFYGDWLFFLCNNAQHTGMTDKVRDFRLCCRTILLDPFTEFMYWHMNYHTEHHMYAAVPCYNLGRLHKLIEHDMPHCPRGVIESWKEITEIQRRLKRTPVTRTCRRAAADREPLAWPPRRPARRAPLRADRGLPAHPAPTLFVLVHGLERMQREPVYTDVARLLAKHGFIGIILDPPCRGEDQRPGELTDMSPWRLRLEKGEDYLGAFDRNERGGARLPGSTGLCGSHPGRGLRDVGRRLSGFSPGGGGLTDKDRRRIRAAD